MGKLGPLPPARRWEIPEHCKGYQSELLLQALNLPCVAVIVCRGCGKTLTRDDERDHIRAAEKAIAAWTNEKGREKHEKAC